MDLSTTVSWIMSIVIDEIIIIGVVLAVVYWWYGHKIRQAKNPMVALIRHTTGYISDHLVGVEDEGRSVKVDSGTYILRQDKKDEEFPLAESEKKKKNTEEVFGTPPDKDKSYPTKFWVRWPAKPFLGAGFLQRTLRAEIWDEGNPEPLRSFYGTITKEGYFVGHLHATASEITSMKNVAEAAGIVGQAEEAREAQKVITKALTNQPNKMLLYIGLGIAIVVGVVNIIYQFNIAGMIAGG